MSLMVKMTEIDSEVISNIRKLKKKSRAYKILKHAIKQDGQLNPILIRQLTDTEKQTAKEGAVYGIIDGHHRYQIALENNQESILAEIDTGSPSDYRDMELALRLNVSNISMSTIEKGEVIYNLIRTKDRNPLDEMDITEIGQRLFGIKTSMTYRCLNAYKKANNIPTIERPRDVQLPSLASIHNDIDLLGYHQHIVLANINILIRQSDEGQQLNEETISHSIDVITDSIKLLQNCKKSLLQYVGLSGETAQNNNDNGASSDIEN